MIWHMKTLFFWVMRLTVLSIAIMYSRILEKKTDKDISGEMASKPGEDI